MDKYGIIGNPVEHSLSPVIHAAFLTQTHQSFDYVKIKTTPEAFVQTVLDFRKSGGRGLNVTLPFKTNAFALAEKKSDRAALAQAASVLDFRPSTPIYADNYDGLGLVTDLRQNQAITLAQKNILILGAGGATQGILGEILKEAPARVVIANRTAAKAEKLATLFEGPVIGQSLLALEKALPFDLIIHATSLGHQGQALDLPKAIIQPETVCYDLSYGKAAHPFLAFAKRMGAKRCLNGLGMLIEHNAAVFHLWRGIFPKTLPVIEQLQPLFH